MVGQPHKAKKSTFVHHDNFVFQRYAEQIRSVVNYQKDRDPITPPVSEAITLLWADWGVQEAYNRRSEYQLGDCAKQ